jgi:hypothetical protein
MFSKEEKVNFGGALRHSQRSQKSASHAQLGLTIFELDHAQLGLTSFELDRA